MELSIELQNEAGLSVAWFVCFSSEGGYYNPSTNLCAPRTPITMLMSVLLTWGLLAINIALGGMGGDALSFLASNSSSSSSSCSGCCCDTLHRCGATVLDSALIGRLRDVQWQIP